MKPAFAIFYLLCCSNQQNLQMSVPQNQTEDLSDDTTQNTLYTRFSCPDSFARQAADSGSFAFYLRHLALKPAGSRVKLFNGSVKPAEGVYAAVVDMEITSRDLQQCADAVMRLRGEYLFSQKRFSEIGFRFLGDGRIHRYVDFAGSDRSYKTFRRYMDHVFAYANTASLHKQLNKVVFSSMQAGDVLIQTGNPFGHAVIVADVCSDVNGRKLYMLAQSYMPAQETQILLNPATNTVWCELIDGVPVQTPEWTFRPDDLKRW